MNVDEMFFELTKIQMGLESADKALKSFQWIKCSDRMPTKEECELAHGWFLVFHKGAERCDMSRYDYFQDDHSYTHGWKYAWDYDITHWMLLPEGPNE